MSSNIGPCNLEQNSRGPALYVENTGAKGQALHSKTVSATADSVAFLGSRSRAVDLVEPGSTQAYTQISLAACCTLISRRYAMCRVATDQLVLALWVSSSGLHEAQPCGLRQGLCVTAVWSNCRQVIYTSPCSKQITWGSGYCQCLGGWTVKRSFCLHRQQQTAS